MPDTYGDFQEEMDMINFWIFLILLFANDLFQVWLPELIAAAGSAPPEFNFVLAKRIHNPVAEIGVWLV